MKAHEVTKQLAEFSAQLEAILADIRARAHAAFLAGLTKAQRARKRPLNGELISSSISTAIASAAKDRGIII